MTGGWIVLLAMALAVIGVVIARALGRLSFARSVRLPIERARLRIFVRLGEGDRTGAHLGVLAAGLAAAYVAVVALAFVFLLAVGMPTGESRIFVGEVLPESSATGKLQSGDQLVAVDGELLGTGGPPLSELVGAKQGAPVTLTVRRAGARFDVTIQPKLVESPDEPRWILGLRHYRLPVLETAALAAADAALVLPLARVASLVSDLVAPSDPGGPVRIVEEFRAGFDRVTVIAGRSALDAATWALLVVAILDLVRAAGLALAWLRRRRS